MAEVAAPCKTKKKQNSIKISCQGADTLPLDAIEDFQGGLKKRGKREIDLIIKSIERFGFSFPFFIWNGTGHNYCLDGHGRIQALAEMRRRGESLPTFPVVYVDAADEAEAKQKLLRLNSQYGQMTVESVMEFSVGLDVEWGELSLPSGALSFSGRIETVDDDEIPEAPHPVTRPGDLYEISTDGLTHRLLCGDATDAEAVARVMGGGETSLFITDPPYNVAYVGKTAKALKIQGDNVSDAKFRAFLTRAFTAAIAAMKAGATYYIWHADSEGYNFRSAVQDSGLQVRQCLVWNKSTMVMGRQDYQWKHEPCLYGWKDGAAHFWNSDRKQTTVLEFDRPSRSEEHPTMKPVDLFAYLVGNSTKPGDVVLDTFLGSGTSMVAAEKTGRTCYGIELDPVYCDVIVRRFSEWCAANGRECTVSRNGEPFDLNLFSEDGVNAVC